MNQVIDHDPNENLWTDCMVDLETTGLEPDNTGMIQLAAIKFSLARRQIGDIFCMSLALPPKRYWDVETQQWWLRDKADLLRQIMSQQQDAQHVMDEFVRWANSGPQMTFWSKPTHFDFPFLQSYCRQFNKPMPFHYRTANDMNSWIRALFFPEPPPPVDVPFEGDAHNAVFDALHQIMTLFAYQNIKEGKQPNDHAQPDA